jgi:hypothetical protein
VPVLAMTAGLSAGFLLVRLPFVPDSLWFTAFVKVLVFLLIYGGILLLLEWRQTIKMVELFLNVMPFFNRKRKGMQKEIP